MLHHHRSLDKTKYHTFVSAKKDGLVIFVSFRDVCKAVLAAAAIMEVTQGEVLGLLEGEQVQEKKKISFILEKTI